MCNYCNKAKPKNWDNLIPKKEFKNDSLTSDFESIIKGDIIEFNYDAYSSDSSFNEQVKIKYCPMCGNTLTKPTHHQSEG